MQAESKDNPPTTAQTPADIHPELTDDDKWSAEVVDTRRQTLTWGIYEFEAEAWLYADGRSHLTIAAPEEPIPCAHELIRDWLADDRDAYSIAAATLAAGWNIDIEEVRR